MPIDDSSPGIWASGVSNGKWRMARHLIELDQALVRAAYEPDTRLIVEAPPRHGKSALCSVYFPAWYRRKFPTRNFMLWSATGRLAQRFSTHVRELCGVPLDERTHSWEHWKLEGTGPNEGEFYAAGVGGGATMGAGFHCAIIDDYFKDVEAALSQNQREKLSDWYLTSCLTRAEPGASLIVIATRWHREDLIGFIKQQADEAGETWQHIRMQAINDQGEALWPERWPIEKLKAIERRYARSGYGWMWQALYQQEPPEVLDSEWDPSYFNNITFNEWPRAERVAFRIMALDPSVGRGEKSDYSAIVLATCTTDGIYYIEADLQRRDAERQVTDVLLLHRAFQPCAVAVEVTGFQAVLEGMFNRRCREMQIYPYMLGVNAQTEKRMRIRGAVTPFLARGMLKFKAGSPGTALLLEQLRNFPSHKYDDGPDALAMCLEAAAHVRRFGLIDTAQDERLIAAD